MHGWGSIPGTTQVPGEIAAGHQKIYAALEPFYKWHHSFLTGNRSVSTKEECGAISTLQRMRGNGMTEASAEWIQDWTIFAKAARAAVVWANVSKLLMDSWVISLNKTLYWTFHARRVFLLCYASYWHTELLSIDLQAELCSTALLMPSQSTSIAFWRFPTVEFPLSNHKLQMTNLSTERSLQVLLDHLSDNQYLGAIA